jgi:hypothetical protein
MESVTRRTTAEIVAFPAPDIDPAWLTRERMVAYYVALSVQPEIAHAPPMVRSQLILKVIAGMRQAERDADELDVAARRQCLALMQHDAETAQRDGWVF